MTSLKCFSQEQINSDEVIYHVFLRSFYDSNGDGHGDLNGLRMKLGYLKDLGVTSILLTPINSSEYYHNYFSHDFEKIDPKYGSMQDFVDLAKQVHQLGMKIYLDMETQYVTEDHQWWKESLGNLSSPYSDYILYDDAPHTKPSTIIFGLTGLKGYNGVYRSITTVNLRSPKVLDYNIKLFSHFADPNKDGKFDDGADGFRLDHAMDTLDFKLQLSGLFETFWNPLIVQVKKVNPHLIFTAEQANWASFGTDYYTKAGVDRVFAFNLLSGIASFNKQKISNAIKATADHTPVGKQQIVFIENHDVQRFATSMNKHVGKMKVGAALNLLLGNVPSIYYGQELGMTGAHREFNSTDGNDILLREAFEWNKSATGKGMALWYKDSGPWWAESAVKPNDGVSLEEEQEDPNSLYNFYKTLLRLRKKNTVLQTGGFKEIANLNNEVFSFIRYDKNQTVLVVINLSDKNQSVKIPLDDKKQFFSMLEKSEKQDSNRSIVVRAYEVQMWNCK